MHGYSRVILGGGWKYTCGVINSRSDWSCNRWAIVHLPQTEDKAGSLHLDVYNRPQFPRPLHITDGKEVLQCIIITHDTDRITTQEIGIHILPGAELSTSANHIAIVEIFYDCIDKYSRRNLSRLTVSDPTVESRHYGPGVTPEFRMTIAERILVSAPETRVSIRYLYWL